MPPESPPSRRGRGRPPSVENLQTAKRLLDAATDVCAERGYDGTTLTAVAERAGVTPTAIYNHFPNREELLYAAARQAIDRITALATRSAGTGAGPGALASVYLRPDLRSIRRLLAELHLASARDPELAELLAGWHRAWERAVLAIIPPSDPQPRATVKALYLLLLGLCHLDDLPAVRAPRSAVADRMERLANLLVDIDSPVV